MKIIFSIFLLRWCVFFVYGWSDAILVMFLLPFSSFFTCDYAILYHTNLVPRVFWLFGERGPAYQKARRVWVQDWYHTGISYWAWAACDERTDFQ